jgi:hypothetical protein
MLPACICRRQQKSPAKPGRFAIAGRGWLEIVYWTCQSVTGRVALLAPVGSKPVAAMSGAMRRLYRKLAPRPPRVVKQALMRPSESVTVIRLTCIVFTEEGHCCARTARLVQHRHDGHAARVPVMRACIARTCARHRACRVPVSPWPIPDFSDKPDC